MTTQNQSDGHPTRRSILKAGALALGGLATIGTTTPPRRSATNTVVDNIPFFVVDKAGIQGRSTIRPRPSSTAGRTNPVSLTDRNPLRCSHRTATT